MSFTPDYIIVGAGSAGCVLANRLSDDPSIRVLLLEAGGRDNSLLYRMPAGFFPLMKTGKGNWNFESVAQPGLNGRTMYFPRGKVLGGSSSINGLVVSRGNVEDYDNWARLGNPGWSWADCLPYFKRIERYPGGDPEYRGHTGPIGVTLSPIESMNPSSRAWIEAGIQAGHPFNSDMNAGDPFGMAQMQGNYSDGVRQSASACYLQPAMYRSNLRILTGVHVKRVLLTADRAIGIEYLQGRKSVTVHAKREVILSGGAINSPQILQLSGIGNPDELRALGIEARHELPGVGENLLDHIAIAVKQRSTKAYSLRSSLRPLAVAKTLAQYLLYRSGPAACGALEAWAHLKTSAELTYPDLQIYSVPLMYNDHGRDIIPEEGFMSVLNISRPLSSGTVKIRSSDPTMAPAIDPRYFSNPADLPLLRQGIRMTREIHAQAAYDEFRGSEYAPGAQATSDAQLDDYIRNHANSLYHPVGTCMMGNGPMAVVDAELRVRGIKGLRVIDASIMPEITSGNTNFPTMMIAEKAADMLLGNSSAPSPRTDRGQ